MKFYITYFYNVRFLKPNQIPISTAASDPTWYHNNTGNNLYCFLDINNVINGIREETLSCKYISKEHQVCQKNCLYKGLPLCPFLKGYAEYLSTVNFSYIIDEFARIASDVQKINGFIGEPEIILLVHEKPDNPCSERKALVDLFNKNGYDLQEWSLINSGIIF